MNIPYDPEKVFHELEATAEAWTNSKLLAEQIERYGEILLSKMMLEARRDGVVASLCKESARARDEWRVHIDGEISARNKADRALAKYRNTQALADARRTQESSARALTR